MQARRRAGPCPSQPLRLIQSDDSLLPQTLPVLLGFKSYLFAFPPPLPCRRSHIFPSPSHGVPSAENLLPMESHPIVNILILPQQIEAEEAEKKYVII